MIIFSLGNGYAQDTLYILDDYPDRLHPKIRAILDNKKEIVRSISFDESYTFVEFGFDQLIYRLVFFEKDSAVFSGEYVLRMFYSLPTKEPVIIDTAKLKVEVNDVTDEIVIESFTSTVEGNYIDNNFSIVSNESLQFKLYLILCDIGNNSTSEVDIIWPYDKYVDLDSFVVNDSHKVFLGLQGRNFGFKKASNPYPWVERYRLLLFDIESFKFLSSLVVSSFI